MFDVGEEFSKSASTRNTSMAKASRRKSTSKTGATERAIQEQLFRKEAKRQVKKLSLNANSGQRQKEVLQARVFGKARVASDSLAPTTVES